MSEAPARRTPAQLIDRLASLFALKRVPPSRKERRHVSPHEGMPRHWGSKKRQTIKGAFGGRTLEQRDAKVQVLR